MKLAKEIPSQTADAEYESEKIAARGFTIYLSKRKK
jgi:hypothetical protein